MRKLMSDGGDDASPAPRDINEIDLDTITNIVGLPGKEKRIFILIFGS